MCYDDGTMTARLLLFLVLVIAGCGGLGTVSDGNTEPQDTATAERWSAWARQAQQIAVTTAQRYSAQALDRAFLSQQIDLTAQLAEDIRSSESTEGLVVRLSESVDEMKNALQFVLEFAQSTGSQNVSGIRLRPLEDATQGLNSAAKALGNAASGGEN